MKKHLLIYLIVLSTFVGLAQNTGKNYYYYKNEKRYLELDTNYVFISFTGSDLLQNDKLSRFGSTTQQKETMNVKLKQKLNKSEDFYWAEVKLGVNLSSESYSQRVSSLKQVENVQVVSPYFKSANSKRIGLSNFFYVKVKTLSDTTILQRFAKRYNTIIVKQDIYMPLWFALSCTKHTGMNALELANIFYESGMFQYAEPDLMLDDVLSAVDDPYFPNQWGLQNTGQYQGIPGIDIKAADAWCFSTGNGVNVAVVDQGIQLNHPDLQANIHTLSYDTENGTSPSIVRGDHGTACSGIIGAIGNTTGVKGVAPNCRLISVSSTLNLMTTNIKQKLASGFNWAMQNGAHVISNSWGHNDLSSSYIDDAITNVLTNGRNGLGCVVVFASGNDDGQVSYPANSNPNILVVGAISPCGQRKSPSSCDGETTWGSNYGSTLDVVAPGVLIPTTDRAGYDGYNPKTPIHTGNGGNKVTADYGSKDFTVWFNGTSSACPHVAGVAALLLSINPNLTGQQVRTIIENTAQKVGGYSYTTTTGRPNGAWNSEMGYGLVNAYAAVSSLFTISGPDFICSFGATYTVSNPPAGCTVSWSSSSNLTLASASGNSATFVANGSGAGWVHTTITGACGSTTLPQKTIWIGGPTPPTMVGCEQDPILQQETAGCFSMCQAYVYKTENDRNFTASGLGSNTQWEMVKTSTNFEWAVVNGKATFLPYNTGIIGFKIRVSNSCGWSPWSFFTIAVVDCSRGGQPYFTLYPNPASSEVTLTINSNNAKTEQVSALTDGGAHTYRLEIMSWEGKLLRVIQGSEAVMQIPLSGLPKGRYIIRLTNQGEVHSQQLLIE